MAAAKVDNSPEYIVGDPCGQVGATETRVVKIQNVASGLWACLHYPQYGTPVVAVAPDTLQYDADEVWNLILVNAKQQYYHIQNVTSRKYAWVSEPPVGGENVLLKETRQWKISHVQSSDGEYTISPVGLREGELFWTDVSSALGAAIELQGVTGRKSYWRFRIVNQDKQPGN